MPYLDKPFNVSKESFDAIFGSAKLMYIASVSAYLVTPNTPCLQAVLYSNPLYCNTIVSLSTHVHCLCISLSGNITTP